MAEFEFSFVAFLTSQMCVAVFQRFCPIGLGSMLPFVNLCLTFPETSDLI